LVVKDGDKGVEEPHVDGFCHRARPKGNLGSKG
jgi:hypothetical protein